MDKILKQTGLELWAGFLFYLIFYALRNSIPLCSCVINSVLGCCVWMTINPHSPCFIFPFAIKEFDSELVSFKEIKYFSCDFMILRGKGGSQTQNFMIISINTLQVGVKNLNDNFVLFMASRLKNVLFWRLLRFYSPTTRKPRKNAFSTI